MLMAFAVNCSPADQFKDALVVEGPDCHSKSVALLGLAFLVSLFCRVARFIRYRRGGALHLVLLVCFVVGQKMNATRRNDVVISKIEDVFDLT
jgi:hypothetical protein